MVYFISMTVPCVLQDEGDRGDPGDDKIAVQVSLSLCDVRHELCACV